MPDSVLNVNQPKRRLSLAVDSKRHLVLPILILAVVVITDQITKIWAAANLSNGEIIQVLGSFFQMKLVYNTGGALGTELGSSTFYLVSSFLILGFVIYFIYAYRNIKPIACAMASIAGGAIGNIVDRIRLGKVIDFLDFDFINFSLFGNKIDRWWVFNISDAAITVGIIFLLIYIIFQPKTINTLNITTDNISAKIDDEK